MIKISDKTIKNQKNFWNNCLFHPTDAIEDSWGRRILDKISEDKAVDTVRIYSMFEDIVYIDENGDIAYDFRVNDLRLDYLVEKGFDVLIAYGFTPECIATNKNAVSSVSKNKTRYKGKMINTSMPKDLGLWEDICYEYTKHIVERYGIETVSKWHLNCWNEPDVYLFLLSDVPEDEEGLKMRAEEYCRLYEHFERAVRRVDERLHFGGPALGIMHKFLDYFLKFVKEKNLRLDYIAFHNYSGKDWYALNAPDNYFSVEDWIELQNKYLEIIDRNGFSDREIVVDEWGMASNGFFNVEECPKFIDRETEVYSAYYVKLIHEIIRNNIKMEKLMICLSGQHEMVTDFSGFRNFFTLNFFAKPIYSAYVLASRLHRGLLDVKCSNEKIYTVPTKNEKGDYAILLSYSGKRFEKELEDTSEELVFDEDISGKKVTIWCIDRDTANPYGRYLKMGKPEMTDEVIKELRKEGKIKPIKEFVADKNGIDLNFTANCVYLVEVTVLPCHLEET